MRVSLMVMCLVGMGCATQVPDQTTDRPVELPNASTLDYWTCVADTAGVPNQRDAIAQCLRARGQSAQADEGL